MTQITVEMLNDLRRLVADEIGEYRMAHTLGTEQAVARLAALYCPERENMLRAAALLHDVTKELPDTAQAEIFSLRRPSAGSSTLLMPEIRPTGSPRGEVSLSCCTTAEDTAMEAISSLSVSVPATPVLMMLSGL